MQLVTKFDKLAAYLEEKEYYSDPDLQPIVDSLSLECTEAEEEVIESKQAAEDAFANRKRGAWW